MGDITACRNLRIDYMDKVVRKVTRNVMEIVNLQCEEERKEYKTMDATF
jgi:hypothetical protein